MKLKSVINELNHICLSCHTMYALNRRLVDGKELMCRKCFGIIVPTRPGGKHGQNSNNNDAKSSKSSR